MLGNGNLFRTTGGPENNQDNIYHLAHMIALLGPPPKDFLERAKGDRVHGWFDESGEYHRVLLVLLTGVLFVCLAVGKWKGAVEVPEETLEDVEKRFEGEEKALFLNFTRKMLKWKPEERSSAKELLDDPWLNKV